MNERQSHMRQHSNLSSVDSLDDLQTQAMRIRTQLEPAFRPETAVSGSHRRTLSAGQCAAAAAIVLDKLGGIFVSAIIDNESHWFNRIAIGDHLYDVDITGDQFGRAPVQIAPQGTLYDGTRPRRFEDLNEETRQRAASLAQTAGFGTLRHIDRDKS
jgi:hypothetical protein